MVHGTHRLAALACCLAACGGSSSEVGTKQSTQVSSECAWPAAADTYDTTNKSGCTPSARFDICEVPNGSTVEADGGVILADGGVGVAACTNACSATQYALSCYSGGALVPIPAPAWSLGCQLIPIPTPSGALFYCCGCAK